VLTVVLAGCAPFGDDDEDASAPTGSTSRQTTDTRPLHEAVPAPAPQVLSRGDSRLITSKVLQGAGFQIACVAKGQRATIEFVRGQNIRPGTLVTFPNGGPTIKVEKRADGAYVVRCV
jgi:hypothetical protein